MKLDIKTLIPFLVIMIITLACGFGASTAKITDAKLSRDFDGNDPTTIFAQNETFYCTVVLKNAPENTNVKASWTAMEVAGEQPNTFLDEAELTTASGTLHFELINEGFWPVGKYKVDIFLNGGLERTLEFEVQ